MILLDFENVNSNRQNNLEAMLMNKLDENVGTKKDLWNSKLTVYVLFLFGCFIVKPI